MPEQFDESWEYFEPDPEIAEVMRGPRLPSGVLTIPRTKDADSGAFRADGFRFGHPGAWRHLHFARAKPLRDRDESLDYHRLCVDCDNYFMPQCSRQKRCQECRWKRQQSKIDRTLLASLLQQGLRTGEIAVMFNVTRACCRFWASRLNFPECARGPKPKTFTHDGVTLTLPEWSKRLGVKEATLRVRKSCGLPLDKILEPIVASVGRGTREPIMLTFNGETRTLYGWEKQTGISRGTLRDRYLKGMTPEKVLTR